MWKLIRVAYIFGVIISLPIWASGQEALHLNNPSFEDIPRAGGLGAFYLPIQGWKDCARSAFPGQTPPDIHPHPEAWMVTLPPADGKTYLGMVVREDDTHEFLSQKMSGTMIGGQCYSFTVYLAQSDTYMGYRTAISDTAFAYDRPFLNPSVLRIWAGNDLCGKEQLLGESTAITGRTWTRFNFKFEPKRDYTFIILEAFYETPVLEPYNGHILVDACSSIEPIACEEELVFMEDPQLDEPKPIEPPEPVTVVIADPKPEPAKADPPTPAKEEVAAPEILSELDRKYLKEGQTIRIRNLYFPADSDEIKPESYKVLNEIAAFLKFYDDVVIEIGGHTATVPPDFYCDSLSTARARAVNDYLVGMGVDQEQLQFKGYGKQKPLIPDDSQSFAARRKNQRVEIKVLSLEGQGDGD